MPQVSKWVQTLNKEQQRALARVFARNHSPDYDKASWLREYRKFRRTVVFSFDVAMVQWSGMWLGIEHDGYTHS